MHCIRRVVVALPLRRLLVAAAVSGIAATAAAPAAWASCQWGRSYVVQPPPEQLFIAGTAETRWVSYMHQTFDDPVETCGLKAIVRMPGVILYGWGGDTGSEVSVNSVSGIGAAPRSFTLGIAVTAATPPGDGVIEFRNKLAGPGDGNGGPLEDLVVGVVPIHINQPALLIGDLVGTLSFVASADVGGRSFAATTPTAWTCPAGYQLSGTWRYTDGFWLCARKDLAGRTFWIGDAERGGRWYYRAQGGGSATYVGTRRWDTCDGGTWLARHGDSTGWWVCMEGALPEVLVADVRHFETPLYSVYSGGGTSDRAYFYGTANWNECPWGYAAIGAEVHENGFWVCARADLSGRTFWLGDVEDGIGYYYRVARGTASFLGTSRPWNTCDAGAVFVGRRTATNGFWVCIDAPRASTPTGASNPALTCVGDGRSRGAALSQPAH
jgi:hypothetical protein